MECLKRRTTAQKNAVCATYKLELEELELEEEELDDELDEDDEELEALELLDKLGPGEVATTLPDSTARDELPPDKESCAASY